MQGPFPAFDEADGAGAGGGYHRCVVQTDKGPALTLTKLVEQSRLSRLPWPVDDEDAEVFSCLSEGADDIASNKPSRGRMSLPVDDAVPSFICHS